MTDKLNIIRLWIEKADHDLGTAEIVNQHIPNYMDTIAFHCQQAVEKYLKAFLIFLDIGFKRTHDLVLLLDLISTKEQIGDDLYEKAAELQAFSVEIRYPDTIINLTEEDIMSALAIAREFRELVISKIYPGLD